MIINIFTLLKRGLIKMTSANNISERMDRLPTSKVHYRLLWLVGLGMFLDSFDIYLAGGVLGALVKSGWSNINLNATFISATFMGLLIGALMAGFIGDSKGRKFAYQVNLLIFGLAALASAVAPNMTVLIIFRGIMGIGLGAEIVVGYALIGEFAPAKTRGKWVSLLSLITNSAVPISALLGFLIIPNIGWRYMFVLVGIFALVVWFLRRNMPESPRWYVSKGMYKEADEVVTQFELEIEKEKGIKLEQIEVSNVVEKVNEKKTSFSDLFKGKMVTRTLIACMILIAINALVYSFTAWVPTLFLQSGINVSKSLQFTMIMMFGAPVGACIGIIIADRVGRKWSIVGLLVGAGILGYVYSLQTVMPIIISVGFLLTVVIYILVALGLALYVPELFPTEIRFRGTGFSNAIGRLSTIFSPYLVAWLILTQGVKSVFIVLGVVVAFVALIVAIFGVETKQKSLDEI